MAFEVMIKLSTASRVKNFGCEIRHINVDINVMRRKTEVDCKRMLSSGTCTSLRTLLFTMS
jgi:hypothetical protein